MKKARFIIALTLALGMLLSPLVAKAAYGDDAWNANFSCDPYVPWPARRCPTTGDSSGGGGGGGGGRATPPPPPPPDFTVKTIVPTVFRVDTKALIAVNVENAKGGTKGKAVVTLEIDGSEIEMTKVEIASGNNGLAFAHWEPDTVGDVEITATVNKGKKVSERNYNNNTLTQTATVTGLPVNIPPALTRTIPRFSIEDLPDDPVISETEGTGVEPPSPELLAKGVEKIGNNKDETSWKDAGKSYYGRLALSATASDRSLKSGYGFELDVTATISTDYKKTPLTEYLSGPLQVAMYVPETQYEKAVMLEKVSGDGLTTTWKLPVNESSPTGARQWYIPAWYPDGVEYTVLLTALGAYTPGGELTASETIRIRINGSMYEDDHSY